MGTSITKLLFIDTNIWLDFYRSRNDASLALLKHAESVADRIVVTYQLESEFKKNRQSVILEGMQDLKAPTQIPRPAVFSDTKTTSVLNRNLKEAENRVKILKTRLKRILDNPAVHDPVYKACQRIFHKEGELVLRREDKIKHMIRRKAFRRFLHGCPPRKKTDTSIGDAFNWEWMIHCANGQKAELVIVTRDSDYGVIFDNRAYINDHLRQEFSERVSRQRKLLLYSQLSQALKHFQVPVTQQEEEAEEELLSEPIEPKKTAQKPQAEINELLESCE